MTAKDLIQKAEEPYRTQMLENSNVLVLLSENFTKLSYLLGYLFVWVNTEQGYEYWEKYYDNLIKKGL